jgi:hypothetical protein
MRAKACEGVLRVEVTQVEPRPEVYLVYDGLGGISQRPLLRDLVGELEAAGSLPSFLDAMRQKRSGNVDIYFSDYVSYGIGGGDATAEFFFGRNLILHRPAVPATETSGPVAEELVLFRRDGAERLVLESSV